MKIEGDTIAMTCPRCGIEIDIRTIAKKVMWHGRLYNCPDCGTEMIIPDRLILLQMYEDIEEG